MDRNTQIVVMDFGSQYAHLIARRVRDMGVFSEVISNEMDASEIKSAFPELKGIILSGGPDDVTEPGAPQCDRTILEMGLPVLGICYGHHIITHYLGGVIGLGIGREYGLTKLHVCNESLILAGLNDSENVWMNHGNSCTYVPGGFVACAKTDKCVAVISDEKRRIFGVQFHPEVTHTACGGRVLSNFVFDVCGSLNDWSLEGFVRDKISEIREFVGERRAIIGLSGGVDSSVSAVLMSRAIGNRLTAVFVDTGFMRLNECDFIHDTFSKWDLKLEIVDAGREFLSRLKGVVDPEEKRKIIGDQFIRTFDTIASRVKADVLVQGTIYPDRIESGASRNSSVIKSHHNVGGLPKDMRFELCEPLSDLYKDEVRTIGRMLGLSGELVDRHPFPGPGLAIRIIGEVNDTNVSIVQMANHIVLDVLHDEGIYNDVWQAFAVLLPIRSVGVQGDARSYKMTVAVRMVNSVDAMSAEFSKMRWDVLERISTRITNEIPEVNRVVYDITNKPPGTIEWE